MHWKCFGFGTTATTAAGFSRAHAFPLSFCHRNEVSLFACIYPPIVCEAQFSVSALGFLYFVFTMFVSRSIHQFADEREYEHRTTTATATKKLYRLPVQGSLVSSWEMVHTRPIQLISSVIFCMCFDCRRRASLFIHCTFFCAPSVLRQYTPWNAFFGDYTVFSLQRFILFDGIGNFPPKFFSVFFFLLYGYCCRFLVVTFWFAFSFNFHILYCNSRLPQTHTTVYTNTS